MSQLKATILFAFFLAAPFLKSAGQPIWEKVADELIVNQNESPFRQCHASTLVELSTGQLMAAWFGGSHEGNKDVGIWMSVKSKRGWSKPIMIANGIIDDTLRYPCWNPVLFKDRKGIIHLFYKVGPNPREWWGMHMKSMDKGKTWQTPVRLPQGILGPVKNKPIELANGTILSPSSTETGSSWRAHLETSEDGGDTWKYIPIDTGGKANVIQPSILSYPDGRLQVVCRSKQGYVMQSWSSDQGKSWGAFTPTTLINPNSGTDAVTLKEGLQLIVYNPDIPGKEWFNGRSKLRVAISTDGHVWKDIVVLENGTVEEYSYPAVIQTDDGILHITYTYNRKNIKYIALKRMR
jgi:predicted neuraminidase